MNELFAHSELRDLIEKVEYGERLNFADGVRLFNSNDLLALGYMAKIVKERKHGDTAYFIATGQIDYGNTPADKAAELKTAGITVVELVGGLSSTPALEYFVKMLETVKKVLPQVVIQALTAAEIDDFSRASGLSTREVLVKLIEAGLGSLSGGETEVAAAQLETHGSGQQLAPERWLEIMETAHSLGLRTTATLLYGYGETIEDRVEYLLRLRELQDKTGGFAACAPLAVIPEHSREGQSGKPDATTGFDDLKVLAIARLVLDNIDHIKASWLKIGLKLAQVSLGFGVDALDWTATGKAITKPELAAMIRAAGCIPVECDVLYHAKK